MEDLDVLLDRFKKIVNKYDGITLDEYDHLDEPRPNRRNLERRTGLRWNKLLESIGIVNTNKSGVNKRRDRDGVKEGVKEDYSNDKGYVEVTSTTVKTLDEALKVAKVDLEKWVVERFIVNSWTVSMKLHSDLVDQDTKQVLKKEKPKTITNYQVKVWLKPRCFQY